MVRAYNINMENTKKKITKCDNFGREDFYVTETIGYKAFIDDEGILQCTQKDNSIESIICKHCLKEYKEEDFAEINFN